MMMKLVSDLVRGFLILFFFILGYPVWYALVNGFLEVLIRFQG